MAYKGIPSQALPRRAFLAAAAASRFSHAAGKEILPGLRIHQGSLNTAVVERNGKKLLIDSGEWKAVPGGGVAEWALYTHRHRDQSSGAPFLAREGTKLIVPYGEKRFFEDADAFWDSADDIIDYQIQNFRSPLFSPIESVPVARTLRGGGTFSWEGLTFQAIDTPGHTDGSLSYLVEIAGRKVAFTGDLICGPGRIWEMYSLQRRFPRMRGDYWGFGGAVEEVKGSLDRVMERKPDILVPSHGAIIYDPIPAVAQLKANLDAVMENFLITAAWRISPFHAGEYPRENRPHMFPPLPPASYPKWIRDIAATSKAIVAQDKSVFLSDCGNPKAIDELARLRAAGEISSVDGIWITHYHYDHTESINAAKRRFGAKVYAQRELVDITENPTAYQMPVLFPESIRVDRVLDHRESMEWKGFRLTAYHFPGQTLYHAGLLVERDGCRVFFTGDSFANWGIDDYCSQNRCFLGPGVGYRKCIQILLDAKPDLLAASHWGPLPVSSEYLKKTDALLEERTQLLKALFPHDDPNFGTDPYWVRAYPYRQGVLPGAPVAIEARVMNHSAKPMRAGVELKLPPGWSPGVVSRSQWIPPRTEGRIRLNATAPSRPGRRRAVVSLAVTVDGRRLGELAEAIVNFLSA